MKRLYYIRHGETDYNIRNIWSGRSETKLTKKGEEQAYLAGEKLAQAGFRVDLIISSPFERTYATALIIAQAIGYPPTDIQKNNLFVERAYGVLEGTLKMPHTDLKQVDQMEGVETVVELQRRAEQALVYIKSLQNYDDILIVGHGAYGRALQRVIKKIPATDELDIDRVNALSIDNAQVVELL